MAKIPSNPLARLLLAANGALAGLTVDVEDAASVRAAAALVAEDLMTYYPGNTPGEPIGILSAPPDGDYYWWTGGALWSSLLDYRNRSGDTKYDQDISQGLIFQIGPNDNYMPLNWTSSMGNDDQAIWGLAAVGAEGIGFQEPGQDNPQWLTLAKNVFENLHSDDRRVDDGDCDGALRWQIFPSNNGYNYIAANANIFYFNIAAQLARITGNKTYEDAAKDAYDLLEDIGFISDKYDVYDGAPAQNCKSLNKGPFSINAAMLLQGSAFMYNHTNGNDDWKKRVDGLVSRTLEVFFPNGVAVETACELKNLCTTDMLFYKSFLHRGLGSTIQLAPYTSAKVLPVLKSSAKSAAAQCTGGSSGRLCGFHWSSGQFDNKTGPAQQMGVLSALTSILPAQGSVAGNTTTTGSGSSGTSQGTTSSDTPAGNAGTQTAVTLGGMVLIASQILGSFLI
ncbi:glycoside hydrolase family 76 protein [Annulohypoxylon maeteangense]|uniref:glycoside hydrolase family 76 protein n=1 Tax=Annulohypoxylon maeteangense TaxID=1927788 RepID=UPI002008355A|nr:glycoside hydrolase family 76 protein [Annulohypoxylon maeteangense]KAI0889312.1 glycoside hydrolase family 76 protein [Annulohypoxylon maeteangense]